MSTGRRVASREPTSQEQEQAERRAALISGSLDQVRSWAAKWGVPLIDTSDGSLEESMHHARATDSALPAKVRLSSRAWLKRTKQQP